MMAVYYRMRQPEIFTNLINIYANMIAVSPDVTKKIDKAVKEYIELLVPGSKEAQKVQEKNFLKTQEDALNSIFNAIKVNHESGGSGIKMK